MDNQGQTLAVVDYRLRTKHHITDAAVAAGMQVIIIQAIGQMGQGDTLHLGRNRDNTQGIARHTADCGMAQAINSLSIIGKNRQPRRLLLPLQGQENIGQQMV